MLPRPQLHRRKQQSHSRHGAPKRNNRPRHRPPPVLLLAQLEVAKRREDVRQDTRGSGADDLEHRAEITHLRRDECRTPDQTSGQRDMDDGTSVVGGGVMGVGSGSVGGGRRGEEIHHYLAADEGFEGEGGKHVQPEAEAGDVDEGGGGEVIEHVAVGEGAEGEEAGEGHDETGEEGDDGADVGEEGEAGQGGRR